MNCIHCNGTASLVKQPDLRDKFYKHNRRPQAARYSCQPCLDSMQADQDRLIRENIEALKAELAAAGWKEKS